ncbi:MAG: hypothetical protein HLUCCX14_03330 [Marinobacter excellens HL-55]|uniref:Uncharacterized protein n=1 Tax=Marinobacter excellens HL-55 TaxID=1305731 RepID=A0A0N8KL72_9GAMM|nr:MAG: hypothetical protein HLUCCX14_03330 [Marinobacter excellens HL-55]
MDQNQNHETDLCRESRRFAVSANRGSASHRVRYVESGGAAVDNQECTFCQAVPDLSDTGKVIATQVTGRKNASECTDSDVQTNDAHSAP